MRRRYLVNYDYNNPRTHVKKIVDDYFASYNNGLE